MEDVVRLLAALRGRGVRFSVDGGQLRYKCPKGAVTADEIARLRALRAEIVASCQRPGEPVDTERPMGPRGHCDPVALTYCQMLLWNLFELETRYSMRSVASMLRLSGPLNTEALRRSISGLVRRHESLRTQIVVVGDTPWQKVGPPCDFDLPLVDLTDMAEHERETAAQRLANELVNEQFMVTSGPLFTAKLLRLQTREHVLIVALDHVISDGTSLAVIGREMFAMYAQMVNGETPTMPPVIQFPDYAHWQERGRQLWIDKHGTYWRQRLDGARRTRLFGDESAQCAQDIKWTTLPLEFGSDSTMRLRELSRRQGATPVMGVLAAYVAVIARCSGDRDLVVPFLSTGRLTLALENTIGPFGHPLYLRIEVQEDDTLLDLLKRVTMEYAVAYEHDDCGKILAEVPTPAFARNPSLSWFPQDLHMDSSGRIRDSSLGDYLDIEQCRFDVVLRNDMEWDAEVRVDLQDRKDGIAGFLQYRADRIPKVAVQKFADEFQRLVERMTVRPRSRALAV